MSLVETHPRNEVPLRDHDKRLGKYIVAPAFAKKRRVIAEQRLMDLEQYAESTVLNRVERRGSKLGVITSGITYQYVREVAPDLSVFKLGLSYPLPRRALLEFAAEHDELMVVEELEPIFEQKLRSYGLPVVGKERVPVIGELSPDIVRAAFDRDPLPKTDTSGLAEIAVRPPVLCPGCHHRGPFSVLRKLRLHVCGDIGCYTLAAFPPLNAMETAICMGASVGMAFGYEKARGKDFAKQTVAVIGDSTFWHSGVTGLIDIVYGRGVSTVIILDNETTAMTGHQENPSTGKQLQSAEAPRIDFVAVAKAIGVRSVREVDAYDLETLERVIREELERPEPSVIVTRRACLLRSGAPSKAPALSVDPEQCNRCKRCIRLGCPAIELGSESAAIDPSLCAGCGICESVCIHDAIHRFASPDGAEPIK
jgi:indolepyruvate ferredoxin oxidoreductase alpha subunit